MTHALALGPAAVELDVEEEEVRVVLEEAVDDEAGEELEALVEVEELALLEVVGPSGESEPHPTRARTAKPAAARVR